MTDISGTLQIGQKSTINQLIVVKQNSILVSTDKGTSWNSISPGDDDDIIADITIAPNGDIYVADGYGKDYILQYKDAKDIFQKTIAKIWEKYKYKYKIKEY